MKRSFSFFVLVLSTSTWVCCVLPVIITVIVGAAAVGQLITVFPWLIPLTKYKLWLFIGVGALLILDYFLLYGADLKKRTCSVEEKEACEKGKKFSRKVFWTSVAVYIIGLLVTYLLPVFLKMFDQGS